MIDVFFLVLPDSLLLDLAGPAEAFRLANQQRAKRSQPPAFRLHYIGPEQEASSSVGLMLSQLAPLPATLPDHAWLILLGRPGDCDQVLAQQAAWLTARDWLARVVGPALDRPEPTVRLITVCVGSLLAADAGLVGRRRVTTHHELLDDLSHIAPHADVQANRVFVIDGPLMSSAGITAGIDLALHLIGQHCDQAIAAHVAHVMVAFSRRGPHDPQHSPLLAHRDHLHPAVHKAQDAVCAQPAEDWTADRLAAAAHVTPRHLNRLFKEHTGLTPRDYVEHVRAALARHAMDRGAGAAQAAEMAGFGSARRLREVLARREGARHHPAAA